MNQIQENEQLALSWQKALPLIFRVLVWGVIFAVLFLLRSFFLLIFLTFVFSYIQANGVNRLEKHINNRSFRVVLVATILLAVLLAIGAFLVPRVKDQAKIFADRAPTYLHTLDNGLLQLTKDYPFLNEIIILPSETAIVNGAPLPPGTLTLNSQSHDIRKSPSANLIQALIGMEDSNDSQSNVKHTLDTLRNIGAYLLTLGSAFLLSLLFSFLIVLDLPKLVRSTQSLRETKLRLVYDEVAQSIHSFAVVLGRALEAQLFIAIINTILTAIGVALLGMTEKVAFISVIVFLCSFIPVAGVFISSFPICMIALQESGISLMLLAIALITVIHMVEAYVLNPKIYGHHLRMNPVVVLIILTIGGKMFGVWGLVLGVPICTYIFGHAIRSGHQIRSIE